MNRVETEPLLSICCLTYNHAPYLRRAFDGILKQKVNFVYEVLVGEDFSTDDSRKIIDEYVSRYPNLFIVIYRDHNVGTRKNLAEVMGLAKGEYVILLETDDYWTDPLKLQKQVDVLKSDSSIIAVTHPCKMVGLNDELLPLEYPSKKSGVYSLKDYRKDILPGQTATMMYRNYHRFNLLDKSLTENPLRAKGPGDRRKMFMLASYGKIVVLPEVMSCYRFVRGQGSSFSATNKFDFSNTICYYKEFVEYAKKNGLNADSVYTAEALYMRSLWIAFLHRQFQLVDFKKMFREYANIKYKVKTTLFVARFYIVEIVNKFLKEKCFFNKIR